MRAFENAEAGGDRGSQAYGAGALAVTNRFRPAGANPFGLHPKR